MFESFRNLAKLQILNHEVWVWALVSIVNKLAADADCSNSHRENLCHPLGFVQEH